MYDLDGTLVDSIPDLTIAIDNMLQDLSRPPAGIEKVTMWVGNGVPSLIKRALADNMMGDQSKVIDLSLFEQAHKCFRHHYANEIGRHSCLYSGVRKFLKKMAEEKVKQAVITNKPADFARKLLKIMAIDHFFELTVGGDTLTEKKPYPLPLQYTMRYFSCDSDNALMIGDSSNDIKAARATGVKVIGLNYGYNHGEPIEYSNPDAVLSSLSELL